MMNDTATRATSNVSLRDPFTSKPATDRRWLLMGFVAIAQLMVVLDATIVNIALPSAQQALGFADGDRQWVVTAYALAFGSLLLVGGRLGDRFGRKRMFIVGLIGFAGASVLGGAAGTFGLLVLARVLQGAFGAILAPAALSTLVTTFTDPRERARAFGIFGTVAVSGGAIGLILGGVLTEYVSVALVPVRERRLRDRRSDRRGAVHAEGREQDTGRTSTCSARCSRRPACSCWSSDSHEPRPPGGALPAQSPR